VEGTAAAAQDEVESAAVTATAAQDEASEMAADMMLAPQEAGSPLLGDSLADPRNVAKADGASEVEPKADVTPKAEGREVKVSEDEAVQQTDNTQAAGSSSSTPVASCPEDESKKLRRVPTEGLVLHHFVETTVKLKTGTTGCSNYVKLEPRFVARRWSEVASQDSMPLRMLSPTEAARFRSSLVLVSLESEIRASVLLSREVTSHMVAILSECSFGRSEACTVSFPQGVLTLSRSHCQIHLQRPAEGDEQEGPKDQPAKLLAYDDGSLCGTKLNGEGLPVGRSLAVPVKEGDVLRLGSDVTVTLRAVSSLLAIDDHCQLADFFERVGERRTATSLRQEPRQTERILSSSISRFRSTPALQRPRPGVQANMPRGRLTGGSLSNTGMWEI